MPLGFGIGDIGELGVGADSGDIQSQDDFNNGFNTGSFSLNGAETPVNKLLFVFAGIGILGLLIWLSPSNR